MMAAFFKGKECDEYELFRKPDLDDFGGLLGAISWFLAGCLWCVTIIGIPIGLQCFKFASLSLAPFGKEVVYSGSGVSLLLNILWLIFFRNTFGNRSSDECHSLNDYDYWDSFCETVAETSGSSIDAFWCHDRFNKSPKQSDLLDFRQQQYPSSKTARFSFRIDRYEKEPFDGLFFACSDS